MTEPVIELKDVHKHFGPKQVLESVNLRVYQGQTFAFLGRNGAGKTTMIRMLLGLLRPDAGRIRVLGLDPRRDALEIRRRVGYLAEDRQMWPWMKVKQVLSFMAPFYPTWDGDLAQRFADRFELSMTTRVRHLSKGQSVRLGLLLALAHRPKLVIFDDPTLGLDPIMRKEFLRDVVEHLQGGGATVFFSSHLLYEIEPVADTVAILDWGCIVRQASTESLRDDVKQLMFTPDEYDAVAPLDGTLHVDRHDRQVRMVVERAAKAIDAASDKGVTPRVIDLNLDEIFEAYVIGRPDGKPGHAPSAVSADRVA
jgi:ABC-2 type transport system ATP-binding protein